MKNNKISLTNVSKYYKMGETTVKALDDINLEINARELIAVLGPSGAGKTTLLNILGGITTPTNGSISVFGREIHGHSTAELADYREERVSFIFQFFNLFPTLNARENVEIAIEMLGDKEEVREISDLYLKEVGLGDRMNHFPSQLSGGEQQRVAIARALAKQPFTKGNLLILSDEPTGNLDEKTGDKILKLIDRLTQESKATFIIVTHNEQLLNKLDVKRIYIHDGKITKNQ
ncbi:MAG: putative ABC transporter ATP-binding protein [Promethearchaeota archaeon]|nr:MAG: putative ABC transporter ATP-binding protein [Candidatus Lokiarchaeota archaeon]